ncbi:MAG TPA: serine/threonine-protein kinase [Polyangiaceae bacterium]|jgi:serine/threonine-protein kinase
MSAILAPGTVFARDFRIIAPLGQGGMGALYVAEQISTGKRRALKLMHPTLVSEAEHRERFVREAQVGARIASEHVVEVTAAGIDDTWSGAGAPMVTGLPYLAMELLEGETLHAYVKRRGFLPPAETMLVFQQLCHAMMAAHAAGIVHRDLKPENVFLAINRRAGSAPFVVKVLDFGIAKLAAEAGTRGTTGAMGSPLWMAPEQTERGPITAAADVWALGLVSYFVLTGAVFWRAARDPQTTVAQVLREIVLEPIPAATIRANEAGLLDRLPPGFDRFFAQAVVRDPRARLPDASAFWNALSATLEATGATVAALPPSSGDRVVPRSADEASGMKPRAPQSYAPPANSGPGTAPAIASTLTRSPSIGPWIFASVLVVVAAFGAIAFAALHLRPREIAPPSPATAVAAAAPVTAAASVTATAAASVTATAPAAATTMVTATPTAAPTHAVAHGNATDVSHGTNDAYVDGLHKNRTAKVAGHTIRVVPGAVTVTGNVPADVVRDAIDWAPWEFLRCYERQFSAATDLPHGTVVLSFKVFDQLPRNGTIQRSDFMNAAFSKCVLDTAMGETVNAAGSNGFATVVYPLTFTVVD